MKRFVVLFLTIMVMSCFVGCGENQPSNKNTETDKATQSQDTVKVGTLAQISTNEEGARDKASDFAGTVNREMISFDSFSEMEKALMDGKINSIVTIEPTARYLAAKSDELETKLIGEGKGRVSEMTYQYSFLLSKDDQELCDDLSDVIKAMKKDGTLEALNKNYIEEGIENKNLEEVTFQNYKDAETIRVAVTGDLPPMDMKDEASDKPVGYNVALFAEIANRLQVNVEFVNTTSGSREAALSSDQCDVVFYYKSLAHIKIDDDELSDSNAENILPDTLIKTEPYYEAASYTVYKKQPK